MSQSAPTKPRFLHITPDSELVFDANRVTTSKYTDTKQLIIKNIATVNIAYKIKTTAQKIYAVNPSTQVIAPGEEKIVYIQLHKKLDFIPNTGEHRFLIQALPAYNLEVGELDRENWSRLEKEDKKVNVQNYRFSAVFSSGNNNSEGGGDLNGSKNLAQSSIQSENEVVSNTVLNPGLTNSTIDESQVPVSKNSYSKLDPSELTNKPSTTSENHNLNQNQDTNTNINISNSSYNQEQNDQNGQQSESLQSESLRLESKFAELEAYVQMLEESKVEYQTKLKQMKAQEQRGGGNLPNGPNGPKRVTTVYSFYHIIGSIFLGFVMVRLMDRVFGSNGNDLSQNNVKNLTVNTNGNLNDNEPSLSMSGTESDMPKTQSEEIPVSSEDVLSSEVSKEGDVSAEEL